MKAAETLNFGFSRRIWYASGDEWGVLTVPCRDNIVYTVQNVSQEIYSWLILEDDW